MKKILFFVVLLVSATCGFGQQQVQIQRAVEDFATSSPVYCRDMTTYNVSFAKTKEDFRTVMMEHDAYINKYVPYLKAEAEAWGKEIPMENLFYIQRFSEDSVSYVISFCSPENWEDIKKFFKTVYTDIVFVED